MWSKNTNTSSDITKRAAGRKNGVTKAYTNPTTIESIEEGSDAPRDTFSVE